MPLIVQCPDHPHATIVYNSKYNTYTCIHKIPGGKLSICGWSVGGKDAYKFERNQALPANKVSTD